MNQLYPLKFEPIIHDKIWGGQKLHEILNKSTATDKAGESWEISGVDGSISVVSNGFLEGNNLEELIEVYMDDLVGERIFEQFGHRFPLLIKFIDANDKLSIQVHPNDELAKKRHNSFGKTEMWYIIQAEKGAELISGFNREIDKETYFEYLKNKNLEAILNREPVKEGDVFFLPAGRVHAIGSGVLLAEIQQTADVTYRIYDFDRRNENGDFRELHTDLAVDAIDYNYYRNYRTNYISEENQPSELISCNYFTTNMLHLSESYIKNNAMLDSFVIYICVDGSGTILSEGIEEVSLKKGETLLVPASVIHYTIQPVGSIKLLEVYID